MSQESGGLLAPVEGRGGAHDHAREAPARVDAPNDLVGGGRDERRRTPVRSIKRSVGDGLVDRRHAQQTVEVRSPLDSRICVGGPQS